MLCSEILPQHPAILPLPPPGNPRRGGPHPRDLCPVLRLPGPIQALRQSGQLSLCHCREPVPGPLPSAVGTPPCRPARTGGPPAGHPGHPPGPAGRLSRPAAGDSARRGALFPPGTQAAGNRQNSGHRSPLGQVPYPQSQRAPGAVSQKGGALMKRPPLTPFPHHSPGRRPFRPPFGPPPRPSASGRPPAPVPAGISPPAGPVPPQALVAAPGGGAGPALVAAPVRRHRL